MSFARVTNALLRVSPISGPLPEGFDYPHSTMDFAVLELGGDVSLGDLCGHVERALADHSAFLASAKAQGSSITLFVEFNREHPVIDFDHDFLRLLVDAGASLECLQAGD